MITGALTTSAIMALIAAFITEAVKRMLPEQYYRYIPLPLAGVTVGIGILIAYLSGNDMLVGALEGVVAAALAVFGYDTVKGFVASD